jgi:hypothetical protein
MWNLIALGLATCLLAVAPGANAEQAEEASVVPEGPSRRGDFAEENYRARQERKNYVLGGVFEAGSAVLHLGTFALLVGRDLNMPSEGCDAPSKPCYAATPIVALIPYGATVMGIVAASRFAAARDANMWRSPVFWAGMAVGIGAYGVLLASGSRHTRSQRLIWDTTFLSMAVLSTVAQAWGALTVAPRERDHRSYSLRLVPLCGPTQHRGLACGIVGAGL